MALITRATDASLDTSTGQFAAQIPDLVAGEALDLVAPCYIKASDGLVYMSNATADNEAARVDGFTARAVAIGYPVTLFGPGTRFSYGTGLTIGTAFVATTAGRLDTVATLGDSRGVARIISATDIVVLRYKTSAAN